MSRFALSLLRCSPSVRVGGGIWAPASKGGGRDGRPSGGPILASREESEALMEMAKREQVALFTHNGRFWVWMFPLSVALFAVAYSSWTDDFGAPVATHSSFGGSGVSTALDMQRPSTYTPRK